MVLDGVTGRVVPEGNPSRVAEVLIELLRDPLRCRQMGEAGYQLVKQRYTWPAVGERMRAVILPLLGRSAAPFDMGTETTAVHATQ
jgi:glycosyltransferase involved in cell wall biosynthesis